MVEQLSLFEQEVVVEALNKFGYEAMQYLPSELDRDVKSVEAFYGEVVKKMQILLWRNDVKLQDAMAWNSPAMIAAVVKCWDVLNMSKGTERASFDHLSHRLSPEETKAIVMVFNKKAPRYKDDGILWHETHYRAAFGMQNIARQPSPRPDWDEQSTNGHAGEGRRLSVLPADTVVRETGLPPKQLPAQQQLHRSRNSADTSSLWIPLWLCPEDKRSAKIIKMTKTPVNLKLVLRPDSTVDAITRKLMEKWANAVNKIFKKSGMIFEVDRFDLFVLEGDMSVKLSRECAVERIAPLIVTQAHDANLDPATQKCRVYYRLEYHSVAPRSSSTPRTTTRMTAGERTQLDEAIARAEQRLREVEKGAGADADRARVSEKALDMMYECGRAGGQLLDMVLEAGEEDLRKAMAAASASSVISFRMGPADTVGDAARKLQLIIEKTLPCYSASSTELLLTRKSNPEPLDKTLSIQQVHHMEGSPKGCVQVMFRRAVASASMLQEDAGSASRTRPRQEEEHERASRAKKQKTVKDSATVEGREGMDLDENAAGDGMRAAETRGAASAPGRAAGAEERAGVEDGGAIVISDDDSEDEGGPPAPANSQPALPAAMVKREAAESSEPPQQPAAPAPQQLAPAPQHGQDSHIAQEEAAAEPVAAAGQDLHLEEEGMVEAGSKVLVQRDESWKLGLVGKFNTASNAYEVKLAGGLRLRRKLPCRNARVLPARGTMFQPRSNDTVRKICEMLSETGVKVTVEELLEHNRAELADTTPDDALGTEEILMPQAVTDQLDALVPSSSYHEWLGVVESKDERTSVGGRAEEEEEGPSVGKSMERGVTRHGDMWRVTTFDPHTGKRQDVGTFRDQISAALAYDESMVQSLGLEAALPFLNFESQHVGSPQEEEEEEEKDWNEGDSAAGSASGSGDDEQTEAPAGRLRPRGEGAGAAAAKEGEARAEGGSSESEGWGGAEEEEGVDIGDVAALLSETDPSSFRRSRRIREEHVREKAARAEVLDQSMVGREVRKLFDTEWFLGMVTNADDDTGWYTVRYVDGDVEDLFPHSVKSILLPQKEGSRRYLWDERIRQYRWEPNVVCERHWTDLGFRYSLAGEAYIPPGPGVSKTHETDLQTWLVKARQQENLFSEDSEYKRQLQHGAAFLLEVFDTGSRGWGVRALQDIPSGAAVIEYAGEIVTLKECRRREPQYFLETQHQGTYIFELHPSTIGKSYAVDATKVGNAARFINHGCGDKGNLDPIDFHPCQRWPRKLNLPHRIALVSTRAIKKGEELLYDYNQSVQEKSNKEKKQQKRVVVCQCGGNQCRGSIF